jgi:hypothetical protein
MKRLGPFSRKVRKRVCDAVFNADQNGIEVTVYSVWSDIAFETLYFDQSVDWLSLAEYLSDRELRELWKSLWKFGKYTDIEAELVSRFQNILVSRSLDSSPPSTFVMKVADG